MNYLKLYIKLLLHLNNLTFEEFVILSSDAKTNKLLGNEAMNSLDAKVKLSTEFQNNPEFLNFCIENIFKMHHQVSYLFLLQTIIHYMHPINFSTISFDLFDKLIMTFFIDGPIEIQNSIFDCPQFYNVQSKLLLNMFDDLWEQVLSFSECETYIFKNPKNQIYGFIMQLSAVFNSYNNKSKFYIQKFNENGITEIILDYIMNEFYEFTNDKLIPFFQESIKWISFEYIKKHPIFQKIINEISFEDNPSKQIYILTEIISIKKHDKKKLCQASEQ